MLGAASFFEGYDINIVIVALPQIRDTFDLTQAGASLWLSVLYLGAVPAMLLSRRADRIGRRKLLIATICGYTVGTALTAVAPTIWLFALFQFLARLFLIAEVAVAWTLIAEELPAGSRGFGFGFLAMLTALGTGAAALLYALALAPNDISWRWLYVAALPMLAYTARLRRKLPESKRFTAAREQGALSRSWHEILRPPHRSRLILACAALLLAELTTQALVFVVDYMQTQRDLSPTAANLILIAAGALSIPVLVVSGSLSDRYGRRRVSQAFLVLSVAGPLWLFMLARSPFELFLALTATYVGNFGAWPTLGAYGSELFPTGLRAFGGSAVGMAKIMGQFLSFVLAAVLIRATGSLGAAVAILSAGPLLAAIVTGALPETKGRELETISGEELIVPFSGDAPTSPL